MIEIASEPRPQVSAPRDRYVYFPGDAAVGEWQAVNTRNRSLVVEALADLPTTGAHGVLFAMGTRFGGHALYVKDNRLHYVNSFVGAEEQMIVGTEDIPTGESVFLPARRCMSAASPASRSPTTIPASPRTSSRAGR